MFEEEKKVLLIAIRTMEIPQERKNVEDIDDLRWIQNNLGIKNSEHRHFDQAMTIINTIVKGEDK